MLIARYLAIAGALFLAACASGGGGRQVDMPLDLPPTLDNVYALYTANQQATLDALSQAAKSLHSPDAIRTTFDGQQFTALIARQNANELAFDSEADEVLSYELPLTIVPGHAPIRHWTLLSAAPEGATVSAHLVSWNDADHNDYLAAGYWLHLSGVSGEGTALGFENAEAGVFVDGPELSPMIGAALPGVGQASYEGLAQGYYVGRFGTNPLDPAVSAGSTEAGGFESTIQLTADFAEQTIQGCMGCRIASTPLQGFLVQDLFFVDGETGERTERGTRVAPLRAQLFETPLQVDGRFGSVGNVRIEPIGDAGLPPGFVTSSSGSWGGNLSSKFDEAGEPRLVAGNVGVTFQTAVGGEGAFLGTFIGLKQPPAGEPGM